MTSRLVNCVGISGLNFLRIRHGYLMLSYSSGELIQENIVC